MQIFADIAGPARIATLRSQSVAGGSPNGKLVSMFYTYVLKSKKDNEFYIGWTNDLESRIKKHNLGQVEATKYRMPLELVYYEACLSQKGAIAREKQLKTGFGRAYLKRRLN